MHIAGRFEACSTLIIGGFINYYTDSYIKRNQKSYGQYYSREAILKGMITSLKSQIDAANSPNYKENVRDIYNPTTPFKRHKLDGHKVDEFAFFWTTVFIYGDYGSKYGTIHSCLREIGFTIDESETFVNKKNGTKVWPCYGAVPKILAFLDRYDKFGKLIVENEDEEKKEVKEPKRKKAA